MILIAYFVLESKTETSGGCMQKTMYPGLEVECNEKPNPNLITNE